jgi:hypothetical protein
MHDTLVPLFGIIFAIGLPLAIPIVIVVLNYRKRRQLMQLHHIERMAAIERGMEIPPLPTELAGGGGQRRSTSLLPGLIWFFVGIAVWLALSGIAEDEAKLGLIPAGVGVAYLIYYFVEGRKLETRQLEHDLREKSAAERR